MTETLPRKDHQTGSPGGARRRLFLNSLLLTPSLFIALLIGELMARVGDSNTDPAAVGAGPSLYEHDALYGWKKRPGVTVTVSTAEFEITQVINGLGLRGPETSVEKPEGVTRVLLLGDSFLEGYTVEVDDLVSTELEHILNRDGVPHEVLNAGTAGYSTDQELLYFEEEGVSYQPDATVLLFYVNDVWFNTRGDYWRGAKPYFELLDSRLVLRGVPVAEPTEGRFAFEVEGGRGAARLVRRADAWLGARSALYLLIRRGVTGSPALSGLAIRLGAADVPGEFKPWQRSPDPETERAWAVTEALLVRLHDRLESSGGRFLVFYVPSRAAVYDDDWSRTRRKYAMSEEEWSPTADADRLRSICERRGLACSIRVDRFRSEAQRLLDAGDRLYFLGDGHWTAAGHRLAASLIAEAIGNLSIGAR